MDTWLTVDLRRNRFAAGLLTIGQGKPRWNPEQVYTHVATGATDSRAEIDLSFFRAPKDKRWSPILSNALPELAGEYETINALFDQPADALLASLPGTLGGLLSRLPTEYADSPLLFLVDRSDARSPVQELLKKARRKGQVAVVPCLDGLAGFALLDLGHASLPDEGATFAGRIRTERGGQEGWRYTWLKNRFRVDPVKADLLSECPVWESLAEMERVAAALFALFWRDRTLESMQRERQALGRQSHEKSQLLERMQEQQRRLAAGRPSSLVGAGA
jgi:hypothetical protein